MHESIKKKLDHYSQSRFLVFLLLILANRNFNRKFHNRKLLNRRSIKKILYLFPSTQNTYGHIVSVANFLITDCDSNCEPRFGCTFDRTCKLYLYTLRNFYS